MIRASVILPVRGRTPLLTRVLSLLDEADGADFEIVVVADHCPDTVAAVATRDFRHPCRLFSISDREADAPFGAAPARNLGARFATGELLIFLDADCLVAPGHVDGFLEGNTPETLQLGPIDYVDAEDWTRPLAPEIRPIFAPGAAPPAGIDEATWRGSLCWTGNFAVPREAFRELGGFDLAFTGAGGEDADFGLRFAARHGQVGLAGSRVRHVGPTAAFAHARGERGPLDSTGVAQRIRDGHYAVGSSALIANGGGAYFEDDARWRGFSDLREGRTSAKAAPPEETDAITEVFQTQLERSAAALLAIARRVEEERPLAGGEAEFLALYRIVVATDPEIFSVVWSDPQAHAWARRTFEVLRTPQPDATDALARCLDAFKPLALACAHLGGERLDLERGFAVSGTLAFPGTRFSLEAEEAVEVRGISGSEVRLFHPGTGAESICPLDGRDAPPGFSARVLRCPVVAWRDETIRLQPSAFRTPEGTPAYMVPDTEDYQARHGPVLLEALEIVARYTPAAAALAEWLRVVAFNPPERSEFGNTSNSDLPGAIAMLGVFDPWELAETLVHELYHHWLFSTELGGGFFTAAEQNAARDPRYYSPWRMEPRPLKGLFHGFYVFVAVARHWLSVLEGEPGAEEAVAARARERLAELSLELPIVRDTIANHGELSAKGRRLFQEAATELREVGRRIAALGVPVHGTEAERSVQEHREQFDSAEALARLGATLRFTPEGGAAAEVSRETLPKVSALCVTRGRVAMLERAVRCFLGQTHPNRELVVVHEEDDLPTEAFVAALAQSRPEIVSVRVARDEGQPLGELRNLAVAHATGDYVCQWDDDDWYHPERIEAQLRAVSEAGRNACVLSRWTTFDAVHRRAYLSQYRLWEGSLLCARDRIPSYPALGVGEDTPVVTALRAAEDLVILERPELYVYVGHGGNTWTPGHFDAFFQDVLWLGAERSAEIAELLEKGGA